MCFDYRKLNEKIIPNWYGPFLITSVSHPVYQVEIETANGKMWKTLSRDCLKLVKHDIPLIKFTKNVQNAQPTLSNDKLNETESSDDEEQPRFEDNIDEQYRDINNIEQPYHNRFRRQRQAPERFEVVHANTIQIMLL